MRLVFLVLIAALLLIQPLRLRAESGCLRVASIAEASDLDFGGALGEALYREAGLCATVIRLPTERIKRMLEAGELDAVVVRTKEFAAAQPGLLLVPTPLLTVDGRLYWRIGEAEPRGPKVRVGFPRGWVWPRREVEKLGADPVEVDNNGALVKMAETGRIEGFLMASYEFEAFVASQEERGRFASISIKTIPLYHSVTEVHADLIPALDAAIQRLVARGDIARLLAQHPAF